MLRIPELDKTMSIAKAISGTLRTVTTTGTFRTATISTGGGEYNMTGWHVRPLHHGAGIKNAVCRARLFVLLESSKGGILCQDNPLSCGLNQVDSPAKL